ncbi:hypothetical protein PF003_g24240 [Phytophthora fragariae]|nr:hypothetical protein PF003_g24240 [Phytophthora fragariae]
MSMRDYVQKTRHLVSCIVTNPIDVASQVHVFIFGMREGMTGYCLTRAEPFDTRSCVRTRAERGLHGRVLLRASADAGRSGLRARAHGD